MTLETSYAAMICTMAGMGLGVSVVNPLVSRGPMLASVKVLPFEPAIELRSPSLHSQQHVEQALARVFFRCLDSAP